MNKVWNVAEPCPPEIPASWDVPPVVAQVLWNRGVRSLEDAQTFLKPTWEDHVHAPTHFRHLPLAVERVLTALAAGEKITVHGDYDADGITGSTVLITTLREIENKLGKTDSIDYYLPHRDKEGYGLNKNTVAFLAERGTKLLITVDCGIACPDEIALARTLGIDTIVVDHHQFGETLPDAYLVHPGLPDETYPFKHLAAVGVSFKFAQALLGAARARGLDIPEGWEKWLLDLVAIATVTDMVPLIGENRVLETYGLRVLNKTKRPGLLALFTSAGLVPGALDTESVGFAIGPRINAAGRMDHASLALRLLLSESAEEATALALELEGRNRERQQATRKMMEEAEAKIEGQDGKVMMLWDESWSPALVGLVAGRLMERFSRPCVAIGQHGGTWIGSGRSIAAYDITQAMRASGEGILTRVGGHVQACGFALEDAVRLPDLKARLLEHAEQALDESMLQPTLEVDGEIALSSVNMEIVEQIESMAPFGMANPKPTFVARNAFIVRLDRLGAQGQHLKLEVTDESGQRVKVMGFRMADRWKELAPSARVDVAFSMSINEWNGRRSAEGRLVDLSIL
jgi:single-stranded-DNA-specific exonuclease